MSYIQFHHKGSYTLATLATKRRVDLESLLVLPIRISILILFYVTEK